MNATARETHTEGNRNMNTRILALFLSALLVTACGQETASRDAATPAAHADHGDEDKHARAGHAPDEHDEDGHGHDARDEDGHADHGDEDKHARPGHDRDAHDEDGHGHDEHAGEEHGHEEEGRVRLSAEQMRTAGIEVAPLRAEPVAAWLTAPGEVQLNAYRTVNIAPRIPAQIVARHARLGDEVKAGQALISLSSVEMAEAQGQLLVASREWQRVKALGRKVVSERRYTEARVAWEQALARVRAYGMTQAEIDALLAGRGSGPDGTFRLFSPQAGRVLHDEFIVGQRVEPGTVLMVIADESVMWVEVRIKPEDAARIAIGAPAVVLLGEERLPAKVSQIHHALDETTRTLAVRLEVENREDRLHPGMFLEARIATRDRAPALTLPEAAVLRSPDGDWQVFVQDAPGVFRPVEVKLLRVNDGRAVIAGLAPGTPVVIHGAFFVQSELAKAGFEIHNH